MPGRRSRRNGHPAHRTALAHHGRSGRVVGPRVGTLTESGAQVQDSLGRSIGPEEVAMKPVLVNVDNFARAESNRMLAGLLAGSGVDGWNHFREPAPLDNQTVIRMNRDTLYSGFVADISKVPR